MAYDRVAAAPSEAAHDAAEALDVVYEAIADGLSITDLSAFFKLQEFLDYILIEDKGEMISRILQVAQLLERDNSLLNSVVDTDDV